MEQYDHLSHEAPRESSPFKKGLMILGGLFLALVLSLGGCFGVMAYKGRGLDKESKAYVDVAVPSILNGWNEEALKSRAAPELIAAIQAQGGTVDENVAKMFRMYQKMGTYSAYNGCTGQSWVHMNSGTGTTISAEYVAKVALSTGPAEVKIGLLKKNDAWRIAGFYVNSAALLEE